MSINRNNYEEYFLLYIDNELSEAERGAVELFVEENPDLRPELESLQNVVLDGDDVVSYPGKHELLSTGSAYSIVNSENCIEYFISYADNELNNLEKAAVEQFVYHHPEHQQDFEIFQKARFDADRTIIFEDKKSLLRTEAVVRPIAGWLKYSSAVAAAVIFLIFGYLQFKADPDVEQGDLFSKDIPAAPKKDSQAVPKIVIPEPVLPVEKSTAADQSTEKKASPAEVESNDNVSVPQKTALSESRDNVKPANPSENIKTAPVENLRAAKPTETTELTADSKESAVVETNKLESLHQENLQLVAQEVPEMIEQKDEDASDISIANISVSRKSGFGRMIRRTSRFLNKTKNLSPTIPGLVIGNLEIAVR